MPASARRLRVVGRCSGLARTRGAGVASRGAAPGDLESLGRWGSSSLSVGKDRSAVSALEPPPTQGPWRQVGKERERMVSSDKELLTCLNEYHFEHAVHKILSSRSRLYSFF